MCDHYFMTSYALYEKSRIFELWG